MLSEINKSVKVIPSTLDFYDIAGLVKVSARQLAPVPRTDAKSLDGTKRLFGGGGGGQVGGKGMIITHDV